MDNRPDRFERIAVCVIGVVLSALLGAGLVLAMIFRFGDPDDAFLSPENIAKGVVALVAIALLGLLFARERDDNEES